MNEMILTIISTALAFGLGYHWPKHTKADVLSYKKVKVFNKAIPIPHKEEIINAIKHNKPTIKRFQK